MHKRSFTAKRASLPNKVATWIALIASLCCGMGMTKCSSGHGCQVWQRFKGAASTRRAPMQEWDHPLKEGGHMVKKKKNMEGGPPTGSPSHHLIPLSLWACRRRPPSILLSLWLDARQGEPPSLSWLCSTGRPPLPL